MKIIKEGEIKKAEPIIKLGEYACLSCSAVFLVESGADIEAINPEPSWSDKDERNGIFLGKCPFCGDYVDLQSTQNVEPKRKGWFW